MEVGVSKLVNVTSSFTNKEVTFVPSLVAENQDVLREILSRLPVKSLVRFKCVSKEWFALLNQVLILILKSNLRLLYVYNFERGNRHMFSLLGINVDTLSSIESPALVLDQSIKNVRIAGSDNGLVCLHHVEFETETEQIFVWNPVTKQYKKLPQPLSLEGETIERAPFVGFGFIQGHGMDTDYKVVRISLRRFRRLATQVYTRSCDSWKELKDSNLSCYTIEEESSITLNGVLYFLAMTTDSRSLNDNGWRVFSFNLHHEVFDSIPLPSDNSAGRWLFAWNNLVACSLRADSNSSQYDVWVMRTESGDETQMPANWKWTKQVTIKPSDGWFYCFPYGVWDNQFILIKYPGPRSDSHTGREYRSMNLCAYDFGNQRDRILFGPVGLNNGYCRQVVNYEESLVSVE